VKVTVALFRFFGSPKVGLGVIGLVWAVGAAILFVGASKLRFVITNIDGIQYIRIAEHYFAGRIDDAINAYWSPMISWSMLPFMSLGIDSQFSFYLASATWSVVGVAVGTLLVWRRTGGNLYAALAMEGVLLALYAGNLMNTTPDLLTVTWTLMFGWALLIVDDYIPGGTRRQLIVSGAVLGAVMAIGYFIKAFALPVFIVVGLAWLIVRLILARRLADKADARATRSRIFVSALAATAALVIVAAPFVTAVSVKYGGFTIGSSFSVNTQHKADPKVVDEEPKNSLQLPPPPNDHAISFGEDRTAQLYLPDDGTGEVDTRSTADKLEFYVTQRVPALPRLVNRLSAFMPFGVLIGTLFFGLIVLGAIKPGKQRPALIVGTVGLVYFLGYWALGNGQGEGGNIRYFWPMLPLSTAIACLVWPSVWRHFVATGHHWRNVVASLLLALIPFAAFSQLSLSQPEPFSVQASNAGLGYLLETPQKTADQKFAEELLSTGVIAPGSKLVAGSGLIPNIRTLSYAYYMRVQIFGRRIPHDITDPRFQQVLRDNDIDFYFLYEPTEDPTLDVSTWGHVVATYEKSYRCGDTAAGEASTGCRLSIVAVD
jgi:hypothetical protein